MIYPDHVTRYNHRNLGYLDAPRVYNPDSRFDWASFLLIVLCVAVMIVLGVMLLQA